MNAPTPRQAVETFFVTLGARCARVDGSRFVRDGSIRVLEEAVTHTNPFPRQFPFRRSFYALDTDAPQDTLAGIRSALDAPDEGFVLNLFSDDPEEAARRFAPHGLVLSWSYDLFARACDAEAVGEGVPDGVSACVVEDESLVERINEWDPAYPSSTANLSEDDCYEIALLEDDRPVAKGEILFDGEGGAHVMQMETRPSHRQQGLGRAVMEALLREAARRGARFAVLNASLEAARANFYPRLGFGVVTRCARLVPAEPSSD